MVLAFSFLVVVLAFGTWIGACVWFLAVVLALGLLVVVLAFGFGFGF